MKRFAMLIVVVLAIALMNSTTTVSADVSVENSLRNAAESGNSGLIVALAEQSVGEFASANELPNVRWINIRSGEHVSIPDSCGSVAYSSTMYGFCPTDATVYIGLDMAERLNSATYRLAAAVGIAHEFGHYLQLLHKNTMIGQPIEDGADCVAGAWLAWFDDRIMQKLSFNDVMGVSRFVRFIAKKQSDDPHGTVFDRGRAIISGYFGGLQACNYYSLVTD